MPWLEKDEEKGKILLVHVPRCGGTSLTKHFNVETKCLVGLSLYQNIGMRYFFYRYRLLEKHNYPLISWENTYAITIIMIGVVVMLTTPNWDSAFCAGNAICPPPLSFTFWSMGTLSFIMSTFVMVATWLGRSELGRLILCRVIARVTCEFGSDINYLHGVGPTGYLMHFTAEKMLKYGYIEKSDLQHSFAIIRNPYSRMVSIFLYNKRAPWESFHGFVKDWIKKYDVYEKTGSTEEEDVYCHVLPMVAFTHYKGVQLVPHIIRQENLSKENFGLNYDLPERIANALNTMPHANRRTKSKMPWQKYYTPEIRDLVYDLYRVDFEQFGYGYEIPGMDSTPTTAKLMMTKDVNAEVNAEVLEERKASSVLNNGEDPKTIEMISTV